MDNILGAAFIATFAVAVAVATDEATTNIISYVV
jgi:hypothetical protein